MAYPYTQEDRNTRQQRLQLYRASITGDLEAARLILDPNRDLVRWKLNENEETPLQLAVASQSTEFVRYLVNMMQPDELEQRNKDGNTAFCLAAIAGNVEMARIMVGRHGQLPTILGRDDKTPLYLAAFHGKHAMVTYLYGSYIQNRGMPGSEIWTDDMIDEILLKCTEAGIFGVGRQILDDHAQLPQDNNLGDVLQILARKPNVFHVKNTLPDMVEISLSYGIWSFYGFLYQLMRGLSAFIGNLVMGRAFEESNAARLLNRLLERLMDKPKNTIDNILKGPMSQMGTYPSHVLFIAAKMNNSKFLVELIREYPDVICMKNDDGHSIFHISVSHRYLNIYNLIHEIGSMKDVITTMTDQQGNNILHLVGMNPEKHPYKDLSAAPYELISDLIWYTNVKAMVPPPCREVKNAAGKTPKEIFNENQEDLIYQGEKWIKESINHSMVVATLVASVSFSVAISIPGGYDQNKGFPLLIRNNNFIYFIIFDASSFFLSTISILIFLSISIYHHTAKQFIPIHLYLGQVTLLFSILALIGAFLENLYTTYKQKSKQFGIFTNLAYVFYTLIVLGFITVIMATYFRSVSFRQKKRMLYKKTHTLV